MVEKSAIIKNAQGIHCRPSAVIVKEIQAYEGAIRVHSESGDCDPRSIMGLLSLGLQVGAEITLSVEGPDEEAVCSRLKELFETMFDFPPRKEGEDFSVSAEEFKGQG